jgi:hypothetical protein
MSGRTVALTACIVITLVSIASSRWIRRVAWHCRPGGGRHPRRRHLQPLRLGQHRRDLRGTLHHRLFGVVMQVHERGGVHRPPSLGLATDTSRCVGLRVFLASKDPSDAWHRTQLPPQLSEDPGHDERGNEDGEPDANHGEHGITAHPGRNQVFPSKTDRVASIIS